jgi:hypothetical protein
MLSSGGHMTTIILSSLEEALAWLYIELVEKI